MAELSANHSQSYESALEHLMLAAKAGCKAVKLQTYTPDTITIKSQRPEFRIGEDSELWADRSLYELYSEAYTPWEWHSDLFRKADELGMVCFSSPFDETAVEFLESLNCPAYKIASFELTHLPLISACARTGKPLIMSTGMANIQEISMLCCPNQRLHLNYSPCVLVHTSHPLIVILPLFRFARSFNVPVGLSTIQLNWSFDRFRFIRCLFGRDILSHMLILFHLITFSQT